MAKSKKIDKDMGFRLKKARLDQKLTYDELSEMSGVSSRYIKEIENHGNIPSLEKLGQLIRALHISADPFFYPAAPTDNLDYQRLYKVHKHFHDPPHHTAYDAFLENLHEHTYNLIQDLHYTQRQQDD